MKLVASFPATLAMCLIVCFQAGSAFIYPWPAYNSKIQLVCPDDTWTLFGNGQCYKYFNTGNIDWTTARDNCRTISTSAGQGDLASVHDVKVNDLHVQLCNDGGGTNSAVGFWIGIYRLDDGVNFGWTDGTPFDFTYFYAPNPDNAGNIENCGHGTPTASGNSWNDIRCDTTMPYLCQVTPDTIPRE